MSMDNESVGITKKYATKTKYCVECGAKLTNNATVCAACGESV